MQHMSCIPTVLGVYNMKVIAMGRKLFGIITLGFFATGLIIEYFHNFGTLPVSKSNWNNLAKTPFS